ncbi:hypothetical protein C8R45DRAFT_369017 [Mycena sanguinolenta]|nr:hypothetical protein C8R45DRAFT_369017 [Mycena sanguinolenta]
MDATAAPTWPSLARPYAPYAPASAPYVPPYRPGTPAQPFELHKACTRRGCGHIFSYDAYGPDPLGEIQWLVREHSRVCQGKRAETSVLWHRERASTSSYTRILTPSPSKRRRIRPVNLPTSPPSPSLAVFVSSLAASDPPPPRLPPPPTWPITIATLSSCPRPLPVRTRTTTSNPKSNENQNPTPTPNLNSSLNSSIQKPKTQVPRTFSEKSVSARRLRLESEPYIARVGERAVKCAGCERTIRLRKKNCAPYDRESWEKHKEKCKGVKRLQKLPEKARREPRAGAWAGMAMTMAMAMGPSQPSSSSPASISSSPLAASLSSGEQAPSSSSISSSPHTSGDERLVASSSPLPSFSLLNSEDELLDDEEEIDELADDNDTRTSLSSSYAVRFSYSASRSSSSSSTSRSSSSSSFYAPRTSFPRWSWSLCSSSLVGKDNVDEEEIDELANDD